MIPEFHKRKRLPVDSAKFSYTIAFTSIASAERLDRPSLYQFFHTFDVFVQTPSLSISLDRSCSPLTGSHSNVVVATIPLFPFYRKAVPLGQPVFLTNDEYKGVIYDREEHEKKWRRHIDRLKQKKKPGENGLYEIKTPIPTHPDRCFVCQSSIPEDVEYREHIRSEGHRRSIEQDSLYMQIDSLIQELDQKVAGSSTKMRKPGKKPKKGRIGRQYEYDDDLEEEKEFVGPLY